MNFVYRFQSMPVNRSRAIAAKHCRQSPPKLPGLLRWSGRKTHLDEVLLAAVRRSAWDAAEHAASLRDYADSGSTASLTYVQTEAYDVFTTDVTGTTSTAGYTRQRLETTIRYVRTY